MAPALRAAITIGIACGALILTGWPSGARGQEIIEDSGWTDPGGVGLLPYLYPGGNNELRFALAGSIGHFPQPHTTLGANLFAGTDGSGSASWSGA